MARTQVIDRDLGWSAMLSAAKSIAKGSYVKVGVLSDDERGGLHAVDPATGKAADLTVAEIAVVQEFGTEDGRIPARSFVRATYDRMRAELEADSAKLAGKFLDRKITVEEWLDVLGAKLAIGIKNYVTEGSGVAPPNAPSTMRAKEAKGEWNAKGQAQAQGWGPRPLVDTGRMLSALSWGVVLGSVPRPHKFLGRKSGK